MSIARTGYKDSEETKLKKSNSFKGRKGTDKQKKAVSDWWATNPERSLEYCIELGKKKLINLIVGNHPLAGARTPPLEGNIGCTKRPDFGSRRGGWKKTVLRK
jgi:hypothetical protein